MGSTTHKLDLIVYILYVWVQYSSGNICFYKPHAEAEVDKLINMKQNKVKGLFMAAILKKSQRSQTHSILRQAWLLCAIQHVIKPGWVFLFSVSKAKDGRVVTKRNLVTLQHCQKNQGHTLSSSFFFYKSLFSFPFLFFFIDISSHFLNKSFCEVKNYSFVYTTVTRCTTQWQNICLLVVSFCGRSYIDKNIQIY